jgi:hypothetical protein
LGRGEPRIADVTPVNKALIAVRRGLGAQVLSVRSSMDRPVAAFSGSSGQGRPRLAVAARDVQLPALPGDLPHILFNLLMMWMIGGDLNVTGVAANT